LPLVHDGRAIAHLMMEFAGQEPPNQAQVVALLHIAPVLGSILVERWLLSRRPHLASLVAPQADQRRTIDKVVSSPWRMAAVAVPVLVLVLLVVPVNYTVGGQAEIVPWERRVAFCGVEGLIEKVTAFEGAHVARGQSLAEIDPTELDFKVESARREQEILRQQAGLLGIESDKTPAKLAEAKILELKMQKTVNDLKFLEWQRQFLQVRAPVEGIVVTKDVESLAGKKLRAGEQFCELAVPGELAAEVFVPEDKVAPVKNGQDLNLYLNKDPFKGYRLTVDQVSPVAEASTKLGNVCRVRARFVDAPVSIKVGMKGIGKIETGSRTLWSLLAQRLGERWNSFALHF